MTVDIEPMQLAGGYLLLLIPLGIMLWHKVPLVGRTLTSVLRMTLQLIFVGLYLQVIFQYNYWWLNGLWLLVMVSVADVTIVRSCNLKLSRFALSMFIGLLVGTATPLLVFVGLILRRDNLLDAQYAVPIAGMILGNCLRANIIGIGHFYNHIRRSEKVYCMSLAQGASLSEVTRPYLSEALQDALKPTMATMATVGLVSLPGMMTGVILGGSDPLMAIKYQIAIMIAIFTGTAITIVLAIWLSMRSCFNPYGMLDKDIFTG